MITTLALILVATQDAQIQELVGKLGAKEFAVREGASKELRKIGKAAVPALEKALDSKDAEVRTRAEAILEEIRGSGGKPEKPVPPARPAGKSHSSSVQIRSVNGNATYVVRPGDGGDPITFHRSADGRVKLEHTDEAGKPRIVEARSLEDFLKKHAKLARRYGITPKGIDYGGARAGFGGNTFRGFRFERKFELPADLRKLFKFKESPTSGTRFGPVSEALRSHFDVPKGQGLVVKRVESGSAAAAAGLRKHDVLLEIDGRPVVNESGVKDRLLKGGSVKVLRRGKRIILGKK